jgi:hypothetical protein
MNRILRGAVLLAVTAALGACGTEPDEFADGTADHIVAEPSAVFISRTDSQNVRIRVVDQQGTSLLQPISISGVGAGINVRADSAYRPIFRGDTLVFNPNTTELRVWVSTNELANSSFTITSGDLTLEVPVVVTPNDAESFPFSTLTPALGEVVTATVTSDMLFTDSTKVVFGANTLTPVSVAEDGSSLTFNAGPDLLGPASFTNVTLSYNKNVVFSVIAADTLNSPSSTQAFAFSSLGPDVGEPITITPPAGVIFTDETEVSFDSAGGDPFFDIAAGGTSMTLTALPGSVGPTTFTNMAKPGNETFTFTLKSADTLENASNVKPFTFSDLTPDLGDVVAVTAPTGLIFTDSTEVSFDSAGPVPHFTVTGGGATMNLTPGPNSVGPTTFTNMVRATNPDAPFSLTSLDTIVSAGVEEFVATADKANAAANEAVTYTGGSSLYKFDIFNTNFTINGAPALVSAVAADSASAVVLPKPGSAPGTDDSYLTGPVVAGFLLDSLPITGSGPTVAALAAPQAGTDDLATAPTINAPAVGSAVAFWDGGPFEYAGDFGDGDRLYKLVVPATQSFEFALKYIGDKSDLGIAIYDNTGKALGYIADSHGGDGRPEIGTAELDAGTYYLAITWFDYTTAASLYGLQITGIETEE